MKSKSFRVFAIHIFHMIYICVYPWH